MNIQETVIKNPSWWRRRTALERGLVLLAAIAVLVAVALVVSLAGLINKQLALKGKANGTLALNGTEMLNGTQDRNAAQGLEDICMTPGCVHAASTLLHNMDQTVNPCDDFYQYACGGYLSSATIPDEKSSVSTFTAISEEMLEKLRVAVEEKPQGARQPRSFDLVRSFYWGCVNKSLIETRGVAPLTRILKEDLGGWPVVEGDSWDESSFDWLKSLYRFIRSGWSPSYLIDFSVNTDAHNNTYRCMNLDQASLGLRREYMVEGLSNKFVAAYHSYQVDLAVLLGANRTRAEKEMLDALDFEIALANISLPSEERRNSTRMYNPYTVDELQKAFPYMPWMDYLRALLPGKVHIESNEKVVVTETTFLQKLEGLLKSTAKRKVANYVMWRAASEFISYMTEELRDRQLQYSTALSGTPNREVRWKECLAIADRGLPLAVGAMYVRRYFKEDAKKAALEMVEGIRKQFIHTLMTVDWMDKETRKIAVEKAKAMTAHIAYPDELMDDSKLDGFYEKLEMNRSHYLESVVNLTKFYTDYSLGQLHDPVNKTEWISHGVAAFIDASYSAIENSIQFPAGILQGSCFSADRPRYMNYGAIGFVIAHEITHGFDDQGRQFDKEGNLVDWWDEGTRDRFLKKAECIIFQYGNITDPQTNKKLNGINTQGENIADNGGIKQAYGAYRELEKGLDRPEPRLPGLPDLSPRQLFWVSAAQTWCSKDRPESRLLTVTTGSHSPENYRVMGPISNRPEFAEDFACPLGSHMNPKDKCQVW